MMRAYIRLFLGWTAAAILFLVILGARLYLHGATLHRTPLEWTGLGFEMLGVAVLPGAWCSGLVFLWAWFRRRKSN